MVQTRSSVANSGPSHALWKNFEAAFAVALVIGGCCLGTLFIEQVVR